MDCAPTLRALDEKKFELEVESDTIEQLTSLLQEQLHRLQARTPPFSQTPPAPRTHPRRSSRPPAQSPPVFSCAQIEESQLIKQLEGDPAVRAPAPAQGTPPLADTAGAGQGVATTGAGASRGRRRCGGGRREAATG